MNRIKIAFKNSLLYSLFNFSDQYAKGRSCMLISNILVTVVNTMTTGVFYTGFLLANDINMVDIGVLGFIPFLTSIFSIFSPMILEHFQKRKIVLTVSRILFYTLNILGITVVPMLHLGHNITYAIFIVLVFLANTTNFLFTSGYSVWQVNFIPENVRANYFSFQQIISGAMSAVTVLASGFITDSLFTSGYSVWQVNFIPENVRANYFSFQQIISGAMSAVTVLASGFITDSVKNSGNQLQVMTIMRLIAFAVAVIECVVLALPREYEYTKTKSISIRSLITTPFAHHKFMAIMALVFIWNFGSYLSLAAFDVYIIDTVQVSYTMISMINASYSLFLIVFAPMWKRILSRNDWLKTFAIAALMQAPTVFLNGFVNPFNYFWLYTTMRLCQHFIGVGLNLTFANMAYLHLPDKDQTHCMSFFVLVTNVASFTGQLAGTSFIAATPNFSLNLFGYSYSNVSVLVWTQAIIIVMLSLCILKFGPILKTDRIKN